MDEEVSKKLYATIGEVVLYIHRAFGIEYCERAVCAILHKLDFVCKQTNNVPCKAEPVEQEAFLGEMVPFLAEIEPDEAVYFLDGVHPQHNARATYAWIKRGEPKNIPANSGRQRVNISGVMNAHRPEEVIIHESERINAQATVALCEKILLKSPGKRAIYLFCDNATYYRNADMQAWLQKNIAITLIHLPTCSPNLNLIERLWKFMRKKKFLTRTLWIRILRLDAAIYAKVMEKPCQYFPVHQPPLHLTTNTFLRSASGGPCRSPWCSRAVPARPVPV